jgi:hypothetical protein
MLIGFALTVVWAACRASSMRDGALREEYFLIKRQAAAFVAIKDQNHIDGQRVKVGYVKERIS